MSVEELWENFWKEITKIRPDFVLPDLRAYIRNYVANGFYTIFHHGWFLYKEGIAIYIYTRLEGRRRECTRLTGRWLKETRMYEKRNRA